MAIHWAYHNGVLMYVIKFLAEQWSKSVGMDYPYEMYYGTLLHYACSLQEHPKKLLNILLMFGQNIFQI